MHGEDNEELQAGVKKKSGSKRRVSSRRVRAQPKDFPDSKTDDACSMKQIKEDPSRFLGCIPLSLRSLFQDLSNFKEMPGDTNHEKFHNTLTINDRVIYLVAALMVFIWLLLFLKLILGRSNKDEQMRAQVHNTYYGYPVPS